jgi:hypothetical protein
MNNKNEQLFHNYYIEWIYLYKEGAVRNVTLKKYLMTHKHIQRLIPDIKIYQLNRQVYQKLINDFAFDHEKTTVMDFHHQLKASIQDLFDEGIIATDPTKKAIIKGKQPKTKKTKFLNQFELHTLLSNLDLSNEIT